MHYTVAGHLGSFSFLAYRKKAFMNIPVHILTDVTFIFDGWTLGV